MRSSFCLYSDGKFYEARPSGCLGQDLSSGRWSRANDTITLNYQSHNVFNFEIRKSMDSSNRYQVVRVIDCYDQPVRFQLICFDTTCQNAYNTGILRIEKGKWLFYSIPLIDEGDDNNMKPVYCNADTITYKWHCNRESIESIDGSSLYFNNEPVTRKIILKNKRVLPADQK